ncbi:MAG: glycosyl hydrolase family 95 catalytic domain-containing protein [Niabella sp.]
MLYRNLIRIILIFVVLSQYSLSISQNIDWAAFLKRNDMVFDTLTTKWEEGIYTGNGLLGNMIYMRDSNSLRIEIGRTDVFDHRGDSGVNKLFTKARLPIGHFLLKPVGKIIKNTAHLNLWNAEATGVIATSKGKIKWRSLSIAKENIIVFETETEGLEKDFTWSWVAAESISPRVYFRQIADFPANPQSISGSKNRIQYTYQPMLAGGDYATAWHTQFLQNIKTTYITVAYNKQQSSLNTALETINNARKKNLNDMIASHRNWWHQYYQKSFLSVPDQRAESFYWNQLYKLASATRSNRLPIDLMGPWFKLTPWPMYWFNLNIQLTYSPLFKANHLELVTPLISNIDKNVQHLINNVPDIYRHNAAGISRTASPDMISPLKVFKNHDTTATESELEMGNLTWLLYYYWQYYCYSQNKAAAKKLLPILKRSVNYYINVMQKGDDGKWHLPKTYSPEYPGGITVDCNYDLSLFRWGCTTLLALAPTDALAHTWKDVLINLTPYPTDSNGLRIGKDVAFNITHRHFSHLLMIYPLHIMNWDDIDTRELITKSLHHWHSLNGALQGYSFTGGASIYATMGMGNNALNYLNQLFSKYIKPNTMYMETGPVIETPLSAATSLQELLLQSWNDKIRIFPAVPNQWEDVSFANMRVDGGFLVSAVRKNGSTKWIKIESTAGGNCVFQTDMAGRLKISSGKGTRLISKGGGAYSCNLKKGETVVIFADKNDIKIPMAMVRQNSVNNYYWGTKSY